MIEKLSPSRSLEEIMSFTPIPGLKFWASALPNCHQSAHILILTMLDRYSRISR